MNILINLVPISQGGGLQNALSFLDCLYKSKEKDMDFKVVCKQGGYIEEFCREKEIDYHAVKDGCFGRACYEFFGGLYESKKYKADVIFSLFGGAPLVSFSVRKVSGFAYSNIIQKEIDFWWFLSKHKKIKAQLLDFLRLVLARQADEIIVETKYLSDRASSGVLRGKKIHVVNMAPSALVLENMKKMERLKKNNGNRNIDILYLSGAHPNKRIHFLAHVFEELNNRSQETQFRLLTTLPESDPYLSHVRMKFKDVNQEDRLLNIGAVSPHEVSDLLDSVDALINVALLESFSNNWVEAWAAGLPLITTDAEWAIASCGKAAVYVDPASPVSAADVIFDLFSKQEKIDALVSEGVCHLASLPTPEEKFNQYIEILKNVVAKS